MSFKFTVALLAFVHNFIHVNSFNFNHTATTSSTTAGFPSLVKATLDDLATGLQNRHFTCLDLVNAYLARIKEVNGEFGAVTEINPDAIGIAKALDAEQINGRTRGPLHGIPILIKNNIATMDRMNNTAGSFALLGATVPYDSTIAAKLRAAGVVILGKTNMAQWAFHRGNGTAAWSAQGGEIHGVYYEGQDPDSSSSGSGVSSALGLALASLGTETYGSILLPSEVSNLVGIKPTVGLTSRSLVIPISARQDTVGPMARTVKDAAYLLQAIAGKDPKDNYTLAQPFERPPDYVRACRTSALEGVRIGVPRNFQGSSFVGALEGVIQTLGQAGATVIDNTNITKWSMDDLMDDNDKIVQGQDFKAEVPAYFAKLTSNPNNIRTLEDLRRFTHADPREDYPNHDTSIWDASLAQNFTNVSPQSWKAYQAELRFGDYDIFELLTSHNLDAIILSTIWAAGLAAGVGSPVITVPMSFETSTPGQPNPMGISFVGNKWSEEKLIGYAYAFEQRTQVRAMGPQPYRVPKTELVDVVGKNASQLTKLTGVVEANSTRMWGNVSTSHATANATSNSTTFASAFENDESENGGKVGEIEDCKMCS